MSLHHSTRHPYSHADFFNNLGKDILKITPLGDEKPVPARNFDITKCRNGSILRYDENTNAGTHLNAYYQEFTGHLYWIDKDFGSFRDVICPRSDFTQYLVSLITESKSHYNAAIYAHFQFMWIKSKTEQDWIEKLKKLRIEYSRHIKSHMDKQDSEGIVNKDYRYMKQSLQGVYKNNWHNYLWQVATFDRLGLFITNHNEIIKRFEDAILMYNVLNQPDTLQNLVGKMKPTVLLDGSKFTIHCRATQESDGKFYVYPDTPKEWCNGGRGIINNYTSHSSIFRNGMADWFGQCHSMGLKVDIRAFEGHRSESNPDKAVHIPKDMVFCENLDDWCMKTGNHVFHSSYIGK